MNPDYQQPELSKKQEIDETYAYEYVSLPSRGLVYPESNPLSSGSLRVRYMTAKHEDILTSQNLISQNKVIDVLLQELIIDDIDYNSLILGDKNAVMFAARIMGYGSAYETQVQCPVCKERIRSVIDLKNVDDKEINESSYNRDNTYDYIVSDKLKITFKLLTHSDEMAIDNALKIHKQVLKKTNKVKISPEKDFTTRIKRMVLAINDNSDREFISNFIENEFQSRDSLKFRKYLTEFTPDIDTQFIFECSECNNESHMFIPMNVEFFWPNTRV